MKYVPKQSIGSKLGQPVTKVQHVLVEKSKNDKICTKRRGHLCAANQLPAHAEGRHPCALDLPAFGTGQTLGFFVQSLRERGQRQKQQKSAQCLSAVS